MLGAKYIDLQFKGKITARWRMKQNTLDKIKDCFEEIQTNNILFVNKFVSEMDKRFERVETNDLRVHGQLHLDIVNTGEEWNLQITKYGLLLQSFQTRSSPSIRRKQPISFDNF